MRNNHAALRAVTMALWPTMDSLDEVIDYAESRLPVMNKNELVSILFIFQNTLLKELKQ